MSARCTRYETTQSSGSGVAVRARPDTARKLLTLVAAGTFVGFLTGLFGVGGGFVIVPALALVLRYPMPQAIGTSLVVIAVNTAMAFAARLGGSIDWGTTLVFTVAATAGVGAGTRIADRIEPADDAARLRRAARRRRSLHRRPSRRRHLVTQPRRRSMGFTRRIDIDLDYDAAVDRHQGRAAGTGLRGPHRDRRPPDTQGQARCRHRSAAHHRGLQPAARPPGARDRPRVATLLPCNVVVRVEDGRTVVEALDPKVIADVSGSPDLNEVAEDAARRIDSALDAVGSRDRGRRADRARRPGGSTVGPRPLDAPPPRDREGRQAVRPRPPGRGARLASSSEVPPSAPLPDQRGSGGVAQDAAASPSPAPSPGVGPELGPSRPLEVHGRRPPGRVKQSPGLGPGAEPSRALPGSWRQRL